MKEQEIVKIMSDLWYVKEEKIIVIGVIVFLEPNTMTVGTCCRVNFKVQGPLTL